MSASQQCRARGSARARILVVMTVLPGVSVTRAGDEPNPGATPECDPAAVVAHVQEQIRIYGPRSTTHEYFGFVYRVEARLASAVARGNKCRAVDKCAVDSGLAARQIPRGAKVLGEWHTHAHLTGSRMLSVQDVLGARNNAHIRCYSAYYAGPDGMIFAWDPRQTSVVSAMNSRVSLGRYVPKSETLDELLLAATKRQDLSP